MKILGLIPARGGSKGVPQKNSKILGNQPMIAYSIISAQEATLLNEIVVSTNDETIYSIAQNLGVKPPFLRPENLALDNSTTLSVVQHTITFFEKQGQFFDAVCLLQPTNPFRELGFIDRAIDKFISSKADSLVSVLPIPHQYNPHWAFEENVDGLLQIATGEEKIITRRQDLPNAFFRDGSIYITKTEVIKNGSLYGKNITFIESNPDYHVNIDTIADWDMAEKLCNTLKNQ